MQLSLDLMQHTGWAVFDLGKPIDSGTVGLGCGKGSGRTPCRWCGPPSSRDWFDLNLRRVYGGFFERWAITEVAYENVASHNGVSAAHIYGACQHALLAECQLRNIPVIPLYQQTWKARIGSKGGKLGYIDRVNQLTGKFLTAVDEDQAAALGVGFAAWAFAPPTGEKKIAK